jgi:2-haloalkanoic acid dehalogenase type II
MTFEPKQIKGLFFDIYATLISWEDGLYAHLLRLTEEPDSPENRSKYLRLNAAMEKAVEHEHPSWKYPRILEEMYARIAKELGLPFDREEQISFARQVGDWPAFPDTVAAMEILAKHYKLFVLSNVDEESFGRTCAGPLKGVHWDGIYTAEQIGSYKPDPRNYEYVVDRFQEIGISKDEVVLVAQSLDVDHVSSKALGFKPGVWIAREASIMGGDRGKLEEQGLLELGAIYPTLGEFAAAVEKAFAG